MTDHAHETLKRVRKEAFIAVVAHLTATAEDFEECATRIKLPERNHFSFTHYHSQIALLKEKAQLLRGQAKHIEGFV